MVLKKDLDSRYAQKEKEHTDLYFNHELSLHIHGFEASQA